jgi:hypothetical protein
VYIDNISISQVEVYRLQNNSKSKRVNNSKAPEFSTLKTKDLLIRFVVLVAVTHNKYTTRESPKLYYYLRVYNVLLKFFFGRTNFCTNNLTNNVLNSMPASLLST